MSHVTIAGSPVAPDLPRPRIALRERGAGPARVNALVLEALHLWRAKPGSPEFFRAGAAAPETSGPRCLELAGAFLAAAHGGR